MTTITAGQGIVRTGDTIKMTGNGSAGSAGTFSTLGGGTSTYASGAVYVNPIVSPITYVGNGTSGSNPAIYNPKATTDYILDTYEMNQIVVEHKLQEQELMKLKDADVNFADHIKSNLTKVATEKIVQKMSFTKIKDINMDVTSFRGRVWVFTKEELEQLIRDAQNV